MFCILGWSKAQLSQTINIWGGWFDFCPSPKAAQTSEINGVRSALKSGNPKFGHRMGRPSNPPPLLFVFFPGFRPPVSPTRSEGAAFSLLQGMTAGLVSSIPRFGAPRPAGENRKVVQAVVWELAKPRPGGPPEPIFCQWAAEKLLGKGWALEKLFGQGLA